MKLLIIGRSDLLDRYVIEAAIAGGHELTLFVADRGDTRRFPEAEVIVGNWRHDHHLLGGYHWDAVIDMGARTPHEMSVATATLSAKANHYTFVSSAWALARPWVEGMDESWPTHVPSFEEATADAQGAQNYSGVLAESERILEEHFDGGVFVVRPGLVVGPGHPMDQLGAWVRRFARGGEMLVPRRDKPVQCIDVRDLAGWIVRCVEDRTQGTCLACGPRLVMADLLSALAEVLSSDVQFVEVDDAFLVSRDVLPLSDLGLWMPADSDGILTLDNSSARRNGLVTRSLEETIWDVSAWDELVPCPVNCLRAGLSTEREANLLQAWLGCVEV